jgi:hypothetical protein
MSDIQVSGSAFNRPHFIEELGREGLTSQEIADSLGMEKRHLHTLIQRLQQSEDLVEVRQTTVSVNGINKAMIYLLSTDDAKFLVTQSSTAAGRGYCRFLIECERKALAAPALPANYLDALKALVASEETRQALALANQSLAIKVREAESFNCLAGACARFGWPQGDADWRSAMGTVAAKIQKELDTRTEKIPDPRFGSVNAHDDRVWQHIEASIPGFKDVAVLYKYLGWKRKPKKFSR